MLFQRYAWYAVIRCDLAVYLTGQYSQVALVLAPRTLRAYRRNMRLLRSRLALVLPWLIRYNFYEVNHLRASPGALLFQSGDDFGTDSYMERIDSNLYI